MLGIFHMPLFFYVSGYLAYKTIPSWSETITRLIKRVSNLIIPLLVVGSAYYFITQHRAMQIISGHLGGYWFLYVLALLTVFFIIYDKIASKCTKWYLYVTIWLIPYILILLLKIKNIQISTGDWFPVNHLVTYYRYYLVGWLCRKYIPFNKFLFENKLIFAIAFIAYLAQWCFCGMHNIVLIYIGGMGAIIVLQSYLQSKDENSRFLKSLSYLGRNSLAIYVIHYFFIPNVSSVLHDFLDVGNPFIWQLTFAIFTTMPIIAVSVFIGKLIEMNKYLNFIFFGKIFKVNEK